MLSRLSYHRSPLSGRSGAAGGQAQKPGTTKSMQQYPNYQDLVLVGGGHAHAIVLQMWAMRPMPGVRLTLVSPQSQTAYSGMLPGMVAGHYEHDDTHIDLTRLCRAAGARFIRARVEAIDPELRTISMPGRPDLEFDLLSIDVGSTPSRNIAGAERALPIKPVENFWRHWQQLQKDIATSKQTVAIGVVGGGAGGCELAMAVAHALREPIGAGRAEVHLLTRGERVPDQFPPMAQTAVVREMARLNVQVHGNWAVTEIEANGVHASDGRFLPLDQVMLCTGASAPGWLANSGLARDESGFIQVDHYLRAVNCAHIFAAGDAASLTGRPLPKAGVYAVRQGPILFHNLRATLTGRPQKPFRPQREFLRLVSCGDRRAVAVRNGLALTGGALWRWKDHIDRQFMARFSELPLEMDDKRPHDGDIIRERDGQHLAPMRCNGCGAKVGADALSRALAPLPPQQSSLLHRGIGDDAAVMQLPAGELLVQSTDQLRAPVEDPWLFGRIAALHALSDLFAMHARPATAQTLVTLPLAAEALTRRDLHQLLAGAVHELNRHDCVLSGGHTSEGAELQLGLSVNGFASKAQLLEKTGAKPGDCLLLTKPLGIGAILVAEGLGKAHPSWHEAAIDTMLQSNAAAAEILAQHHARTLTDITGFGLLGHLLETLDGDAPLGATLFVDRLPLLTGAATCAREGWLSSLQPQNARALERIANPEPWQSDPRWQLLVDPQTSGGLLGAVPAERAGDCVHALRESGYAEAAIVGEITMPGSEELGTPVRLTGESPQLQEG
ncbi:Selenide, water dikinase [Microbulbifer aggregans]|uniref:Selenide, water dikinase n=2 Tax=Microbulbifer aggregans TaxID=1769779 RepID=A0A1C9W3X2_9GAMM|nr:Selenide, water dikinase [Microbulbifer aggregans]